MDAGKTSAESQSGMRLNSGVGSHGRVDRSRIEGDESHRRTVVGEGVTQDSICAVAIHIPDGPRAEGQREIRNRFEIHFLGAGRE